MSAAFVAGFVGWSSVVSGCAGSDGSTAAESVDTAPSAPAPADTPADIPTDARDTDAEPAGADPADTAVDEPSDAASGGAWCAALDLSDEGDRLFESLDTVTGAGVASGLERVEEIMQELESAAPQAIADDVAFLTVYTGQLVAALTDADYRLADADLSGLDLAGLQDVRSNLDAYSERECGRPFGGDTSSG